MEELWKDIKGYEGLYMVSSYGRVKSLNYRRTGKERILKPARDGCGYFVVSLCKYGVQKQFLVHRLVAEAFLPKVEGKEFIDHIIPVSEGGGNEVTNIRYCNRVENQNNPLTKQKMSEAKKGKFGAEHNRSIPIVGINIMNGDEVWFAAAADAERSLNIDHRSISECCKGRQKSAGGYYWYYA